MSGPVRVVIERSNGLTRSSPREQGKKWKEKKERASLMMSDDPKLAHHQRFPKEDA